MFIHYSFSIHSICSLAVNALLRKPLTECSRWFYFEWNQTRDRCWMPSLCSIRLPYVYIFFFFPRQPFGIYMWNKTFIYHAILKMFLALSSLCLCWIRCMCSVSARILCTVLYPPAWEEKTAAEGTTRPCRVLQRQCTPPYIRQYGKKRAGELLQDLFVLLVENRPKTQRLKDNIAILLTHILLSVPHNSQVGFREVLRSTVQNWPQLCS